MRVAGLRAVGFSHLIILMVIGLSGCFAVRTTGDVIGTVGRVGWTTAKVTGKVVHTTGKVVYATGKATHDGVRTVVYMAKGKEIVALEKSGNSLYAPILINRKAKARFLVDTGASNMQISGAMARRLRLNLDRAEPVLATVAGGHVVSGRAVTLKEVRLNGVRVQNVRAIVLDNDRMAEDEGLLGMSFLNHFHFQIDPKRQELILQQRVAD